MVDTFCVQNFIECEKVLVDSEQSMGKFGSQVLSIHYFLVSASESTKQICYSFRIVNVNYIEAKKQSIIYHDFNYSEPEIFL